MITKTGAAFLVVAATAAVLFSSTPAARATVLLFQDTGGYLGGLEGSNYPTGAGGNRNLQSDVGSSFVSDFSNYGNRVSSVLTTDPNPTYQGFLIYSNAMGNAWTPNVVSSFSHQGGTSAGQTSISGQVLYKGWANNFGPQSIVSNQVDYLAYNDGFKHWITFTPDAGFGSKVNSFSIDYGALNSPGAVFTWALRQDTTSGTILTNGTQSAFTSLEERAVTTGAPRYNGTLVLEMSFTGTGNNGVVSIDNLNFDQFLIPEPSTAWLLAVGAVGIYRLRFAKQRRFPSGRC